MLTKQIVGIWLKSNFYFMFIMLMIEIRLNKLIGDSVAVCNSAGKPFYNPVFTDVQAHVTIPDLHSFSCSYTGVVVLTYIVHNITVQHIYIASSIYSTALFVT